MQKSDKNEYGDRALFEANKIINSMLSKKKRNIKRSLIILLSSVAVVFIIYKIV